GDKQRCVAGPSCLLVLMRLETCTARHLEVDLLLEQYRRPAEHLLDGRLQSAAANEFIEANMIRAEIFDALQDASLCVKQARLAIDHLLTRDLGQLAQL